MTLLKMKNRHVWLMPLCSMITSAICLCLLSGFSDVEVTFIKLAFILFFDIVLGIYLKIGSNTKITGKFDATVFIVCECVLDISVILFGFSYLYIPLFASLLVLSAVIKLDIGVISLAFGAMYMSLFCQDGRDSLHYFLLVFVMCVLVASVIDKKKLALSCAVTVVTGLLLLFLKEKFAVSAVFSLYNIIFIAVSFVLVGGIGFLRVLYTDVSKEIENAEGQDNENLDIEKLISDRSEDKTDASALSDRELKDSYQGLLSMVNEYKTKQSELTEYNEILQESYNTVSEKNSELEERYRALEERNRELEQMSLEGSDSQLKFLYEDLKMRLDRVLAENDEYKNEYARLQSEYEELNGNYSALHENYEDAQNGFVGLREENLDARKDYEKLEEDFRNLQNVISGLNEEIDEYKLLLKNSEEETDKVREKYQLLNREHSDLLEQFSSQSAEEPTEALDTFSHTIDYLTSENAPYILHLLDNSPETYEHCQKVQELSEYAGEQLYYDLELLKILALYSKAEKVLGVNSEYMLLDMYKLPKFIYNQIIRMNDKENTYPITREAGLVMLADDIVNTLEYCTRKNVTVPWENVVLNAIKVRRDQNQLLLAGISGDEAASIKKLFINAKGE